MYPDPRQQTFNQTMDDECIYRERRVEISMPLQAVLPHSDEMDGH
jgi:hypothetical protein